MSALEATADRRQCSQEGCGRPHLSRGFCSLHYQRLQRHGQPTGGRTPKGDPMRFLERLIGQTRELGCVEWPYKKNPRGYGRVWCGGRTRGAYAVVCEMAHGLAPSSKHEAAHNCGNAGCVNPHHIRWATHAENLADRVEHGTSNRGERQGQSKLTEQQVQQIRASRDAKTSALARKFGVSGSAIRHVRRGTTWGWLP